MDKESLKKRIERYLKSSYGYDPNLWTGAFDIETLAKQNGWMASTATRILRELAEEKPGQTLETKLFRGKGRAKVAYYRWRVTPFPKEGEIIAIPSQRSLQDIIDYYYNNFNEAR